MKKLLLTLMLLPFLAHAVETKQPAPLTEDEKKLAEAGMKILEEEEKNPHKKPMPKHLQDKMQSGFGTVEGEKPVKKSKKKAEKKAEEN